MSSYKSLLTKKTGTFVTSDPQGDGDAYVTLLVHAPSLGDEYQDVFEDTFDGAADILGDSDWRLIGFFNVPDEEFDPDAGEAPPQFDALLFFRRSAGGESGPVFALDVDGTANGEPTEWAESFEAAGFEPK